MLITSPRHAAEILTRPDGSRIPYPFSTDKWSSDVASELRTRLENKQTPKENAVGVVVGSGGLPYILAYAGLSKVYMVDIHAEAILANMIRIRSPKFHQSWLKYRNAFAGDLSERDQRRFMTESHRASQSGLMGDYALTRQNAESVALWGVSGDFRKTASYIADLVARKGETVTYVHATNVADTISTELLADGYTAGMHEVGEAIGHLPLASDAVIVDSSGNLIPRLYSPVDYPQAQLGVFLSYLLRATCEHSGLVS